MPSILVGSVVKLGHKIYSVDNTKYSDSTDVFRSGCDHLKFIRSIAVIPLNKLELTF